MAELEIDFLMLAAVSYIRAKHFLFPSVMYRMFCVDDTARPFNKN